MGRGTQWGRMYVLVAKSREGESSRERNPEHIIIILLDVGRGGSVYQGCALGRISQVREGFS